MQSAVHDPQSAIETIIAVASAPGLSSQAVVRLSGPRAVEAVASLVAGGGSELLDRKGFSGRAVELELERARLPVWVNVYRAPRSYTREDIVELFVCGSPPVLGLLTTSLLAGRSGGEALVRWARPGEFTLRAFLSGRIDLSQAESVAGLIGATGESEARAARRGLRGELRDRLEELAGALTEITALLEAALDFPDEDLPQIAPEAIRGRVDAARELLDGLRASCARLSGADGTLRVVLAGFPNAGKSTLLNALLRREAAIATAAPGTTRDPVRGVTVHEGRRIEWVDLAGTRSAAALTAVGETAAGEMAAGETAPDARDAGEKVSEVFGAEGDDVIWSIVRRLSRIEVEAADVVLWVMDPLVDVEASLAESRRLSGKRLILVVQKADLLAGGRARGDRFAANHPVHLVSAHRDDGLAELIDAVLATGSGRGPGARCEPPRFLVSAHQQAALDAADEAMARARAAIVGPGYEFVAADMRDVLRALEDLTGRVTNDAILDHVFSRFCIGK